jgi:hypothetical protein
MSITTTTHSYEAEIETKGGLVVECRMEYNYCPGVPARRTGLPEDCDEGHDPEINDAELIIKDEWLASIFAIIPKPEREVIMESLKEQFLEENKDQMMGKARDW